MWVRVTLTYKRLLKLCKLREISADVNHALQKEISEMNNQELFILTKLERVIKSSQII